MEILPETVVSQKYWLQRLQLTSLLLLLLLILLLLLLPLPL